MWRNTLFGLLVIALLVMIVTPVMSASCPGWFDPNNDIVIWGEDEADGTGSADDPSSIADAKSAANSCAQRYKVRVCAFWTDKDGREDVRCYTPRGGDLIAGEALFGVAVVAALGLIAFGFWLRRRASVSPG